MNTTNATHVLEAYGHVGGFSEYPVLIDLLGMFCLGLRNVEATEFTMYVVPDSETGLELLKQLELQLDPVTIEPLRSTMLGDDDFMVREKGELVTFHGLVARLMIVHLLTVDFLGQCLAAQAGAADPEETFSTEPS